MKETYDFKIVDDIIDELECSESVLIDILQNIQEHYGYLPKVFFPYISKKLNISEARIHSVATFYKIFSFEPKGKYVIKICDGTACHVKKSTPILDRLRTELNLSEIKTTTDDLSFTVETVHCLGACGRAPVIMVNNKVYPSMTPDKATELIKNLSVE